MGGLRGRAAARREMYRPGHDRLDDQLHRAPGFVAQRIARYADVVGRENVIAGVDCGFATFADAPTVLPAIAWAKLGALAEGARLASEKLWARPYNRQAPAPVAL